MHEVSEEVAGSGGSGHVEGQSELVLLLDFRIENVEIMTLKQEQIFLQLDAVEEGPEAVRGQLRVKLCH